MCAHLFFVSDGTVFLIYKDHGFRHGNSRPVCLSRLSRVTYHVFTGERTGAALSLLWNYGLSFLLSVFHDLPSYVLQYYWSRSCFLDSDVASLLPRRLGQSGFLGSLGRISEGHGGLPDFLRAGLFDCSRDGKPSSFASRLRAVKMGRPYYEKSGALQPPDLFALITSGSSLRELR